VIVATSSNRKDAPIIKDDSEIGPELSDFVLTHNREIAMRADDSVLEVVRSKPLFSRRARGFVPFPQKVPGSLQSKARVLAVGGELKIQFPFIKMVMSLPPSFWATSTIIRILATFWKQLTILRSCLVSNLIWSSATCSLISEAPVTPAQPAFPISCFSIILPMSWLHYLNINCRRQSGFSVLALTVMATEMTGRPGAESSCWLVTLVIKGMPIWTMSRFRAATPRLENRGEWPCLSSSRLAGQTTRR